MIASERDLARLPTDADPLGEDAAERPTREQVDALWREALRIPIPDYDGETLAQALRRRFR